MQVLLPLKTFAAAKQRLAGVLTATERAHLFHAMIEDVLHVLMRHAAIDRIAICSRDPAARWLADASGIEFIDESKLGSNDLNGTIAAAAKNFFSRGQRDVVVIHGDLPLLSAQDIAVFSRAHCNGAAATVTLAPDRHGTGTNLLAWRALPEFSASYGVNSFQFHCAQARRLGIEPSVCELEGASIDIDTPADLQLLLSNETAGVENKTLNFLHDSGIAGRLFAMQSSANTAHDGDDRERG